MGVLPGGASDVATTKGIYLVSAHSNGDQSIADLVGNDEATVKARYKSHYVNSSTSVWGNPSGLLAQVFGVLGAIPGMGLVEAIINAIINAIVAVLGPIPIIGDVVETLASFLGVTHTTANTAQATAVVAQAGANTANTGLAILTARVNGIISGGATLWDTFDRNVTDIATDPAYDVEYFAGPGTMNLSTADSGVARWSAVGFSDAAFIARDVTMPMTTNVVRVSTVISDFIPGSAGNQAHIKLMARMSADRQNYVVGTVEDGLAEIGYVIAGTYTRMGGQVSVTTDTGELWDLEVGSHGDEWQFRLLQNNAERVNRNDLGHVSLKDTVPGTTYKWVAFGGDCAIGAGPFFTTYQIGMPDFQVLAAGDF